MALFGCNNKHVEEADDGARKPGPEGVYLKSPINLLLRSVFLGAVACHIRNRISRLTQGFDYEVDERNEHTHETRKEGVLPQASAVCIRPVSMERL